MSLEKFILEDIGFGDITSDALLGDQVGKAHIISNESCIVAGVDEAKEIFEYFGLTAIPHIADGSPASAGCIILSIEGPLKSILSAERTALNFMMRMSGIATSTHNVASKLKHAKVAATRKTTPGFRFFEKKAVILGGGDPHRFCLDDLILIKDNHIAILGGVEKAVEAAKKYSFSKKVEIEVESLDDAILAVKAKADIIMMDNMAPKNAKECYEHIKMLDPSIIVEASGNITADVAPLYDSCADIISLGSLTHSVRAIHYSLEVQQL